MLRRLTGSSSSSRAAAMAAAAAAAAVTPSTAHNRAETPTVAEPNVGSPSAGADELKQTATSTSPSSPPPPAWTAAADGWVDAAVDDLVASITPEDLDDAVNALLVLGPPPSPPGQGVVAAIRELDATDDEDADAPAGATTPSTLMADADTRLASSAAMRAQFEDALRGLLGDREVRAACMRRLAADPAFEGLLREVSAAAGVSVPSLLPPAAQAAGRGGPSAPRAGGDPLVAFADALAASLIRLGREVRGVAAALGDLAVQAGYRVHRLLTAPFGPEAHYLAGPPSAEAGGRAAPTKPRRPSADAPLGSPEFWVDVLTTVACAVVAMLVVKRLPRPRPGV